MACIQYVFDSDELIHLIVQTSNRIQATYKNMVFHLGKNIYLVIRSKQPVFGEIVVSLKSLTGMRSSMSF